MAFEIPENGFPAVRTDLTDPTLLFGIGRGPGGGMIGRRVQDSFGKLFVPATEPAAPAAAPQGAYEPVPNRDGLELLARVLGERGVAATGRTPASPSPRAAGDSGQKWQDRLVPVLGAVAGLRGGGNAFMDRWSELKHAKLEERLREIREREYQEDRLLAAEDRAQREQDRQRARRLELYKLASDAMQDVETPQEYEAQVRHLEALAPHFGYTKDEARTLFPVPQADRMTRQRMQMLYDRVSKGKSAEELQAERHKGIVYDLDGSKYTLVQIEQQLGKTGVDPQTGQPFVFTKPVQPTRPVSEFDDFWENEYLPALVEERQSRGDTSPLTRTQIRDEKIKAREKWNTAGRAPADTTPSFSEQNTRRREAQSDLRAQLRDALEHPAAQTPGWQRRLRGEFARAGLDYEREQRAAASEIANERATALQRRQSLEVGGIDVPTADDILRGSSDTPPAAAGAPVGLPEFDYVPGVGLVPRGRGPSLVPSH